MLPLQNIAFAAARKAGEIIVRSIDRLDRIKVETKARNDFVSDVDRNAERAIVEIISEAHPDHSIIGEESGQSRKGNAPFTWIIDPLDGTTNFLRGIPHYCVSIACLKHGVPEIGVVYDPIRDEAFTAANGRGAQLNQRRIRVSARQKIEEAVLGTGIPSREIDDTLDDYMRGLRRLTAETAGIRRAGSAALDLAYVAAGRYEGFWEFGLKPWDVAAGILLVTEAGGVVSEPDGGTSSLRSGNIVAGNAKIVREMLRAIR